MGAKEVLGVCDTALFMMVRLRPNAPVQPFKSQRLPPSSFAKATKDRKASGDKSAGRRRLCLLSQTPRSQFAILLGRPISGL